MKGQRGFTLVEVLAALLILGLVLGLCYRLLGQGAGMVRATGTRADALALAEGQLAALMAQNRIAPGQFNGAAGDLSWDVTIRPRSDGPFRQAAAAGLSALSIEIMVRDGRGAPVRLTSTRLVWGTS